MNTGIWNYWVVVVMMMVGLYIVIAKRNYVKKLMGLSIFQVAVIMLYVSMGKVSGGTPPIYIPDATGAPAEGIAYSNPLPHVLMLTAIVVGVATTAVGLALIVRIREAYGSVEEDEITEQDRRDEAKRRTA
ncbi:MAG: cation:proton antiporter subunit C [Myxococcota bacterium]